MDHSANICLYVSQPKLENSDLGRTTCSRVLNHAHTLRQVSSASAGNLPQPSAAVEPLHGRRRRRGRRYAVSVLKPQSSSRLSAVVCIVLVAISLYLCTARVATGETDEDILSHANIYVRIEPNVSPAVDRFDLYQPAGSPPTAFFTRLVRRINNHKRANVASLPLLLPPTTAPAVAASPTNPLAEILAEADSNIKVIATTTTTTPSLPTASNNQKIKLNHVLRLLGNLPPTQRTVQAGEQLVLECSAAGTPAPEIHWLRNGQIYWPPAENISSTENDNDASVVTLRSGGQFAVEALGISATNGKLLIPCVDASDSGTYSCVAETPFLRKSTETEVTVVGSTKCQASSSQIATPQSSMSENNNPAAASLSPMRRQRSVLLQRDRTNAAAAHQSSNSLSDLYKRIMARRAAQQQTAAPLVRVQSPTQPAHMYMWTSNVMELNGNDVRLMCRAAGSPAPSISWLTPTGVRVERASEASATDLPPTSTERKYEVLKSGDLIVRRLEFDQDMGTFVCTAKNTVGSEQVEMFVYPTVANSSWPTMTQEHFKRTDYYQVSSIYKRIIFFKLY